MDFKVNFPFGLDNEFLSNSSKKTSSSSSSSLEFDRLLDNQSDADLILENRSDFFSYTLNTENLYREREKDEYRVIDMGKAEKLRNSMEDRLNQIKRDEFRKEEEMSELDNEPGNDEAEIETEKLDRLDFKSSKFLSTDAELLGFLKSLSDKKQFSLTDKNTLLHHLKRVEALLKQHHFKGKNQIFQFIENLKIELSQNFSKNSKKVNLSEVFDFLKKNSSIKERSERSFEVGSESVKYFKDSKIPSQFSLVKGHLRFERSLEDEQVGNEKIENKIGSQELKSNVLGELSVSRHSSEKTKRTIEKMLQNQLHQVNQGSKVVSNEQKFSLVKPVEFSKIIQQLTGKNQGHLFQIYQAQVSSHTSFFEANTLTQKLNIQHLIRDLVRDIKHAIVNGKEVMMVRLRPENLGNVNITLVKNQEWVYLKLNVENQMIKDSLDSRMTELRNHLENQEIGKFTVEVSISHPQSDTSASSQKWFQEKAKANFSPSAQKENLVKTDIKTVDLREQTRISLKV